MSNSQQSSYLLKHEKLKGAYTWEHMHVHTRKRKAEGRLAPRNLYKHEKKKKKPEVGLHQGKGNEG